MAYPTSVKGAPTSIALSQGAAKSTDKAEKPRPPKRMRLVDFIRVKLLHRL
jgi:hypothetical protein